MTNLIPDSSNLTHEECFRLTGSLGEERSLLLIDIEKTIGEADNARDCLADALPGPNEDFLTEVLNRLRELEKHVRGENQGEVGSIIDRLEEIETECIQGTEHTKKMIDTAIWALERMA